MMAARQLQRDNIDNVYYHNNETLATMWITSIVGTLPPFCHVILCLNHHCDKPIVVVMITLECRGEYFSPPFFWKVYFTFDFPSYEMNIT